MTFLMKGKIGDDWANQYGRLEFFIYYAYAFTRRYKRN